LTKQTERISHTEDELRDLIVEGLISDEEIQQILNNQAIVKALLEDLKQTEEFFVKSKDDVQRRVLDYHSVMNHAVLNTTLSNIGKGVKE